MQLENIEISRLVPAVYNPRYISEDELAALSASLERWGMVEPIVVNKRGNIIIGGHQRVKALEARGDLTVPVFFVDLEPAEEMALNVALNKTGGHFDDDKLVDLFGQLKALDFDDLTLTGFNEIEIAELQGLGDDEAPPSTDTPDDVPDVPVVPFTTLGDVYEIGLHRLVCGDSTVPGNFYRLTMDAKADLILTDPPYNAAYDNQKFRESAKRKHKPIDNDKMKSEEFFAFLFQIFKNLYNNCKPGGSVYIFYSEAESENVKRAMRESGFPPRQCLIWEKNQSILGRQDYHWQHEPIFYAWAEGAKHNWYGDRKQSTILKFDKTQRNTEHPTMKPVALLQYLINNSSKRGDLVVDAFGGSGSTMEACHLSGRVCYSIELSPAYCDVIVKRMLSKYPELPVTRNGEAFTL